MSGKLLITFPNPKDLPWFPPAPCKLPAPRFWFLVVLFRKTRWTVTRHLTCKRMALKWLCQTKAWFSMLLLALLSTGPSLQPPLTSSQVDTNCPTKTKSTRWECLCQATKSPPSNSVLWLMSQFPLRKFSRSVLVTTRNLFTATTSLINDGLKPMRVFFPLEQAKDASLKVKIEHLRINKSFIKTNMV